MCVDNNNERWNKVTAGCNCKTIIDLINLICEFGKSRREIFTRLAIPTVNSCNRQKCISFSTYIMEILEIEKSAFFSICSQICFRNVAPCFWGRKLLRLTVSSLSWPQTVLRRARIRDRYILQREEEQVFRWVFLMLCEIIYWMLII